MKNILERLKNEPALILGLVGAVISLGLAFGVSLSDEQVGGIMAVVVALLAIITRSQVTPTRSVAAEVVKGQVVTGAAVPPAGEPAAVVPEAGDVSYLDQRDGIGARHPEEGAMEVGSVLVALACIVVVLCGLVWLIQNL